ncbi:hypothetical protein M426DRAFT_322276, partial [Hypoxylon sp. CI-4A]
MASSQVDDHVISLDDPSLPCTLFNYSPLLRTLTLSCKFRAIPLRNLGFSFRPLSDYGYVFEESPTRLAIQFAHKNPDQQMIVIRHAWVAAYAEPGVEYTMRFGLLLPYRLVDMIIERCVEEGAGSSTVELSGPSTYLESVVHDDTSSDGSSIDDTMSTTSYTTLGGLSTIPEVEEEEEPPARWHPPIPTSYQANHDFYHELEQQFLRHRAQNPLAYVRYQQEPRSVPVGLHGQPVLEVGHTMPSIGIHSSYPGQFPGPDNHSSWGHPQYHNAPRGRPHYQAVPQRHRDLQGPWRRGVKRPLEDIAEDQAEEEEPGKRQRR